MDISAGFSGRISNTRLWPTFSPSPDDGLAPRRVRGVPAA